MQNRHIIAALVSVAAPVAAAQTELVITAETFNGTDWILTAELLNPTSTVLATISDLHFNMFGTNINNFEYNHAFDSDFFGPPMVSVAPTFVDFYGGSNTLPPINNAGGVDSSNPLAIATFTADSIVDFELTGTVTGAYVRDPFPIILIYSGFGAVNTPWRFVVVPAPTSASLIGLGGLTMARRRR